MTTEQLSAAFDRAQDAAGLCDFDKITSPKHPRPDICAFILLHEIMGGENAGRDMVCAAAHDQIWLDVDVEKFAERVTEEQVVTLVRCGVMYEEDTESLSMFV